MEGGFEDPVLDLDSLLMNDLYLNGSGIDQIYSDITSEEDGDQLRANYGLRDLNSQDLLDEAIEVVEGNASPYSCSLSELFEGTLLGVKNESHNLKDANANHEHHSATLSCSKMQYPGQSLNWEFNDSSSFGDFDSYPLKSSMQRHSSLNYNFSSCLDKSYATDSSPSSYESCASDSAADKCTVDSSPIDSSLCYSPCSSPVENMVAPLTLIQENKLVEVPKLKTDVGCHLSPACGRGKTLHAFRACNPSSCTRRNASQPMGQMQTETSVTQNYNGCIGNIYSNEGVSCSGKNKNVTEEVLIPAANCIKSVKLTGITKPKRIITVKKSEAYQTKSRKRKIEDLPFWSLKPKTSACLQTPSKKRKCKAYQLEPLPDPKLERCRRNAINAKKNREAKKELINTLQQDLQSSQEENRTMKNRVQNLESKVEQLMTAFKKLEKEKQLASAFAAQLHAENVSLHEKLKIHIH